MSHQRTLELFKRLVVTSYRSWQLAIQLSLSPIVGFAYILPPFPPLWLRYKINTRELLPLSTGLFQIGKTFPVLFYSDSVAYFFILFH
ncbi:hypothetical protein F4859DRAFT_53749 [Xylaria cf. heliscus]|nr:hypothetical protein F4859DRAFT_53749 [Xylaria cf. heliscus]